MNLVYNVSDKSLSVDETSESVAKPSIEESVSQSVNDILNSAETSVEFEQMKDTGKDIVDYSILWIVIGSFLVIGSSALALVSYTRYKKLKNPTEKDNLNYRNLIIGSVVLVIVGVLFIAIPGLNLLSAI